MPKRSTFAALLVGTLLLLSGDVHALTKSTTHFLFVHGSSHGAWCWYKVVTLLQKAGFTATALDMTSDGRDKTDADTVTSLALFAKPLTHYLAAVSGQVLIVGHSIGGNAISYAMELYPGKISKAVFLAAVMPPNNHSTYDSLSPDVFAASVAAHMIIPHFGNGTSALPTSISFNLSNAPYYLYNASPEEDVTLALTLLDSEPFLPLTEVLHLTPANYGSIRRFYIRTGLDHIVTPALQQLFVTNNPPEKTFYLNKSDHSAFFSRPRELTSLLILISKI